MDFEMLWRAVAEACRPIEYRIAKDIVGNDEILLGHYAFAFGLGNLWFEEVYTYHGQGD